MGRGVCWERVNEAYIKVPWLTNDGVFAARADAPLEDVAHRLQQMCEVRSEPRFAFGEIMAAATRLGSKRVILTDSGARRLRMRLSLNMPVDDLAHVLQTETAVPWLRELPV
jgi:hypothetical protein